MRLTMTRVSPGAVSRFVASGPFPAAAKPDDAGGPELLFHVGFVGITFGLVARRMLRTA